MKIQIQIQNNGHLGLGAPPPLPLAVAAHTNISQRLNMVQFIFCLIFAAFSLFVSVFGVLMHLFHVVVACFYHPVGKDTMMINKIAQYAYFRSMQPPNMFCFDHLKIRSTVSVTIERYMSVVHPRHWVTSSSCQSLKFNNISIKSPLVNIGF